MQYDILAYDFTQSALIKESGGKLLQVIERDIGSVCPIECEFVPAVGIISKIACIHPIGNHKQLNIVEQPVEESFMITLYLVVGLFQLHASSL